MEPTFKTSSWGREGEGEHVHGYDSTRNFLSAAGNALVATEILHHQRVKFDKNLAGWWLVDVPVWNDKRFPHPAGEPGMRWVTTPTVQLLTDLEAEGVLGAFVIIDSYTAPGKRLFYPWSQRMNKTFMGTEDQTLRAAMKDSMRATLGLTNSSTYTTYRPDWWHTIVATARCNLFRRMWKVGKDDGMYPVAVDVDCLYYASTEADPQLAAPSSLVFGDGLGQFKVKAPKGSTT